MTIIVGLVFAMDTVAYEPDAALREAVADEVKTELIAATPRQQRFSVRFAIAGNTPFRDYERLAKRSGYPPYDDCSIATFVEITNWQIIQGTDVEPPQIARLYELCEASESTILGPKPLAQERGDREILRGMWQRSLAFVGRTMSDDALLTFVRRDAVETFEQSHGDPNQWQLTDGGFSAVVVDGGEQSQDKVIAVAETSSPEPVPQFDQVVSNSSNAVDQIVLRTVTRYGLSGVYVTNATYLLLNDGSIFRKPFDNPYTMDIAASKRQHRDDWGQWKSRGATLQVTWPGDEPDVWKTWFRTRPATPGQTLQGRFQSADSFGGDKVANFNTIALERDGRFSWASLKGGNTVWLPVYSDTKRAGQYELDQYSIRLKYNDGSVREYAFCFYPKDDQHFVIGANHFVPLD